MYLLVLFILTVTFINTTFARDLPYPQNKNLTGAEIAEQAFYVIRAKLPKNAISKKNKGFISRLINRRHGRKASVNQFESYINNDYNDAHIKQKQLAIFRSGKLKGTGVLITQYKNETKSPLMQLWLPRLRKVRRFVAPDADEFWNGSNLTYGEIFLRKLNDEKHTLLETTIFQHCLQTLNLPINEQSKNTHNIPPSQCAHKGKEIYKLKSESQLNNSWYDYHISNIDTSSFATYRTQYYKNNQLIKIIDIDWQPLKHKDPRAVYPAYLYSKSHIDQSESLFIVPKETVFWDAAIKPKFWSESSLRKIKR